MLFPLQFLSVYVRLCPFCPLSEEEEDADGETED